MRRAGRQTARDSVSAPGRGPYAIPIMLASSHPRSLDHAAMARAVLVEAPVLADKLAALGHTGDAAAVALTEVLRFINLCAFANATLTPSVAVDAAWHELILCTRTYAALCERTFGRFVHHQPGGDEAVVRARFAETLRLYHCHFGTPDPAWWGPHAEHAPTADCGGCESS